MSSLLVLLHLLTPQPTGRKRHKKLSIEEATDHLVEFQKSCQSLEDHLKTIEGGSQPYLLARGTLKAEVSTFYVVLDKKLVTCQSCTSLVTFDDLFKSHFVFSVKYDDSLSSMYTSLQTTVYNIDIGRTEETPRIRELRARLLNKLTILFSQNVKLIPLNFILWYSFAFFQSPITNSWNVSSKKSTTKMQSDSLLFAGHSYSGFRRHLIKTHALTDNTCVPHETIAICDIEEF